MLAGEPSCRLVQPEDPTAMVRALGVVLDLPADRAALASRHGQRSWKKMAEEILALISA
jgi:hypothetical protein